MIRISCELGHNIARYRKKARITQTDLADALCSDTGERITMTMVSNWERGVVDIPAAMVPPVCHILHCSSFELYPHSDVLTDRDVQLIATVKSLDDAEKDDLYYLLHQWHGDRKALLKLNVIHAVQDADLRRDADLAIIESYKSAVKRNDPGIDRRISTDLAYVQKAFRDLLKDEED